jgi:hypothetical protein
MADVLTKIIDGHLASKLDELMPRAYAQPVALKDVARKQRLLFRAQCNKAVVALAAKVARVAWMVMRTPGATYEKRGPATA